MQTKQCTQCNKEKKLSMFHSNYAGKFGVAAKCKRCKSISDREKARFIREQKKKELSRPLSEHEQNLIKQFLIKKDLEIEKENKKQKIS